MRTIQLQEEIPGVCKNEACPDKGSFELYDTDDVKKNAEGKDVLQCRECKQDIAL